MPLRANGDVADTVAAIVLAAGFSSRMGAFKPLLPFGGRSAVSHVVASLRKAGLRHIHVVTGHNAVLLKPELKRLGVKAVHNANFAKGMFTSIQAGVASLPAAMDGFLLLPVDVPMVRVQTIQRVLATAAAGEARIVHPTFRGERGHPPFVSRALFEEILESDGEGGLRAILARHEAEAICVPVIDRGCLQDMDCLGDYRRALEMLEHYHRVPDDDECEAMLETAGTPEPVRRHCRAVAELATSLARRLNEAGEGLDAALIRAAALLHDIAKAHPHHAEAGAGLVRGYGFPEVADAIACHMSISFAGRLDESAVLYLADKLIQEERRVTLEARFALALARFAGDAEALAGAKRRYADAEAILNAAEARIGPVDRVSVTQKDLRLHPSPRPLHVARGDGAARSLPCPGVPSPIGRKTG